MKKNINLLNEKGLSSMVMNIKTIVFIPIQ